MAEACLWKLYEKLVHKLQVLDEGHSPWRSSAAAPAAGSAAATWLRSWPGGRAAPSHAILSISLDTLKLCRKLSRVTTAAPGCAAPALAGSFIYACISPAFSQCTSDGGARQGDACRDGCPGQSADSPATSRSIHILPCLQLPSAHDRAPG